MKLIDTYMKANSKALSYTGEFSTLSTEQFLKRSERAHRVIKELIIQIYRSHACAEALARFNEMVGSHMVYIKANEDNELSMNTTGLMDLINQFKDVVESIVHKKYAFAVDHRFGSGERNGFNMTMEMMNGTVTFVNDVQSDSPTQVRLFTFRYKKPINSAKTLIESEDEIISSLFDTQDLGPEVHMNNTYFNIQGEKLSPSMIMTNGDIVDAIDTNSIQDEDYMFNEKLSYSVDVFHERLLSAVQGYMDFRMSIYYSMFSEDVIVSMEELVDSLKNVYTNHMNAFEIIDNMVKEHRIFVHDGSLYAPRSLNNVPEYYNIGELMEHVKNNQR